MPYLCEHAGQLGRCAHPGAARVDARALLSEQLLVHGRRRVQGQRAFAQQHEAEVADVLQRGGEQQPRGYHQRMRAPLDLSGVKQLAGNNGCSMQAREAWNPGNIGNSAPGCMSMPRQSGMGKSCLAGQAMQSGLSLPFHGYVLNGMQRMRARDGQHA
jgi:hypothetical protein